MIAKLVAHSYDYHYKVTHYFIPTDIIGCFYIDDILYDGPILIIKSC